MTDDRKITELLEEAWNKRGAGNYSEAKELVRKAHNLCKDDDYMYLGRVFHIYMQFESDHDNYAKALEFCQQSLGFYIKSKIPDKVAHSTRHVADLQRHLGQEAESELNYRKAIDIYRSNSDTHDLNLANALRGFGILLEKLKKEEEAIAVWKEVKELYHTCNLQDGVDEANHKLDSLRF